MGRKGINRLWTAAEDALLGKLPDPDVAARLGITKLAVLKRRQRLGIAACKKPVPVPRMMRGAMLEPLPKRLGKTPIKDLTADEYLAAAREISRLRKTNRKPRNGL